ncbi:MAG: hypothetical protein ACRD59_04235 [Candidatus Acidiferrales bacterium]
MLLVIVAASASRAQTTEVTRDCASVPQQDHALRYSIEGRNHSTDLSLEISLTPAMFNEPDLVRLSCQLQKEFPKENVIHALIFDDKQAARNLALYHTDQPNHAIYLWHVRARYELDRGKGSQYVEFLYPEAQDDLIILKRIKIRIPLSATSKP